MPAGPGEPRVRIVPASVGTSGPEAVQLAESTGVITLQPYQRDALADALGEQRSDDGQRRWSAFEVALWAVRQVGKGAVLEARALAGVHLFGERRIVWTGTRLKTVTDAQERMRLYYDSSDDLRVQVKRILTSHVDMAIELYGDRRDRLTGLRRIEFHTRTKHAARGLAGDCVFLDEAYGLTRVFTGALVPIMGTRNDPQLWYTSTPPLPDSVDEMRLDPETATGQVMYDLRARSEAPDVLTADELCYLDWGPTWWVDDVDEIEAARKRAGQLPIRKDHELWRVHNPAIGRLQRVEQVARESRALSLRQFAVEKLGAWPKPPRQGRKARPIPEAAWSACADHAARGDEASSPENVVVAADAAPGRAWASIVVYGVRPDGIGMVEVVDRRAGVTWVPARLAELRASHNPLAVVVSSRGPLASSIDAIKEAGVPDPADRPADERDPRRGDLFVTGLPQDAAATAQLIDAVKVTAVRRGATVEGVAPDAELDEEFAHLDDPRLNAAVEIAVLRDVGDGAQSWGRRSSPEDISTLFAASLGRWGWQQRKGLLSEVPLTIEQIMGSIR
jgi:hypothetical protein